MDQPAELIEEPAEGEVAPISEEEAQAQRLIQIGKIDALGESLAKSRSEAISARETSGIEEEWLEDEEFYQGIDAANRGEMKSSTWRKKPAGQADPKVEGTTRTTVFPNITGPYVDAAAARIADMLLPTDDRPWALKPTPIPELVGLSQGKASKQMLIEAARQYPGQPDLAKKQLGKAVEEAARTLAEAKEKADKAQTRIEDWHVECQFHAHVRQVIEDAARIGVGVLKGPIPTKKTRVSIGEGGIKLISELKPGSKWLDPWNFYPDPACGENIHNGGFTWERDFLTRKQLRELRDQEDYIPEQIDQCIDEGPQRAQAQYKPTPDAPVDPQQNRFEIWYFHGTAERADLEAAGCDCADAIDPHVPAMVTMVNNRVIRASMNPLDTGDFPYDAMVWRRRSGHWAGIGVARQIRTPQRIVTAATRNLMDNAGIAAGPMLVFRQGVVYPADGVPGIGPRKVYYIAQDADEIADATKAIGQIKVDMLVNEFMAIIELGLKLAETVTGLPMILQGQQGAAPDTVGGLKLLNNNASAVLRRLARLFDDRITEPHVRRYYVWLLQHGADDEKGDYCIDARGSSALVERDIANQAILQMGQIVLDPRFGADPKKWFQEFCKSQHLDTKRFEYDDEKWQQIVENMSKGPQDPRVAVAQLRAQVDAQLLQMEQAFDTREKAKDRELDMAIAFLDTESGKLDINSNERQTLTNAKTKLADTVMKLRTQTALSQQNNAVGLTKHVTPPAKPPTEPAGRAKTGKSYVQ